MSESYVERSPWPELAGVVRTVWLQRTGDGPYVQRHLPTGGVELHVPIGGRPRLLGPLTAPRVEVLPPRTTIVGLRFWPGAAPCLPAPPAELVDQRVELPGRDYGAEAERVLAAVQRDVARRVRDGGPGDPLVRAAVRGLMPWHRLGVDALAGRLGLSASQLRRRLLAGVGLSPKVLQRTLRFQGFLALAQAGADGVSGLAVDVGYADQAHLSRECLRLSGLTPRQLLGTESLDRCACGHDHSASYRPFLRGVRDSFKTAGRGRA